MRRAAALSSLSRFLPHRPTNTLRALTCFNPPYQLPCLPYLSFELLTEKNSQGAQDIYSMLPPGLPHWAGLSSRGKVILAAEKLKRLPLWPRLTRQQGR